MSNKPENVRKALNLLRVYTADTYDIWALSGSSKASCRAHIMSALEGTRVPQSKAGVNALRSAFEGALGAHGLTPRDRELSLLSLIRETMRYSSEAQSCVVIRSEPDFQNWKLEAWKARERKAVQS